MSSQRLLCFCITLSLLVVSCGRDPDKVKKAYVERGNEYFKNAKYKEASIMYRSALKKDLKYGEAYYRLGLSELKLGRIVDALRNLRRGLELQPDNIDAASQLADIYLMVYVSDPRRPKEALKELEEISKPLLAKDPNSYLGLRVKGYLAVAANNNPDALAAFEKAHKIKPFSKEVILPYLESLSIAGRFPEAEKLALEMIEREKSFTNIYDWLYMRYTGLNNPDKAESAWKKKVENNPKQPFFIVQLAGHYFLLNRKDEMVKTLKLILDNPKDFPLGHAQVGDFYMRTRDIDSAVKLYEEGLSKAASAQRAIYQKRLFETLVLRNRKQEALDLVSQVLKDNPKDNEAIAMRASLWLQDGSKEKVQSAISELNSVIVRSPENVVLRYNLGRAYLTKGDVDQARIQFQEAIKYKTDFTPARVGLAQLHLAKNEFTKAMQAADDILAYEPQNITALMIRTSSRMGLGDLPTARRELETVLAAQPNFPDAVFQMGILNFQEKKYKEAEANFLHLIKTNPNDPRGMVGRVETLAGTKRFDEAIQLLQDDLAKNPDRSFYRLTLANTAVRAEKYDLAVDSYKHLLAKNPKNFDVQIRMAEALRRKGDINAAVTEFHKARELNPNDPTAYVHLALLYEGTGRPKDARPLYEQILKLDPDNFVALNNLAFVLAETGGDLDMALTMAQRAKAKFPAELNVTDTLGWVYIKKNLSDQAVKIFAELVEKDAKNPIFRYHLAVALAQKGDKTSAKRECEKALQNNPSRDDAAKIRELMSRI